MNRTLLESLLSHKHIMQANVVAAFYPLKTEPDILFLLEVLAEENRLLLPKTKENFEMDFFLVKNLKTDLKQGKYNIWEPSSDCLLWKDSIPVFLIPGTKFSLDGGRHGHGKGFYDRFLAKFPDAYKIGVALESQIASTPLALKPHDIKMNEIIVV